MNLNPVRPSGNLILDALPEDEYADLCSNLERVELRQNDVLFLSQEPATKVYFPITALLSSTHSTAEGEMIEVGLTGYEGLMGTPFLFGQTTIPWQVQVQLSGEAWKLSAENFMPKLHQLPVLQQKITAFTYLTVMQLTQSAICNRFHSVEQRLCRWLRAANDRVKTPELLLTRDILAVMIGSTRTAVSLVTGTLQTAGLIRAARGRITIVNREEMEETTCECYHVIKQAFDDYLLR